jgi:hypothetical protein
MKPVTVSPRGTTGAHALSTRIRRFGLHWGIALLIMTHGVAKSSGARPDDPATLRRTVSLGELIAANPQRTVHIVYVHGMRADGTGASNEFRKGMCRYVPGLCPKGSSPQMQTQPLPLGAMPAATYLNQHIWRSEAEWQASTPFVYRYIYRRANAAPIVVDEVNWWVLLFPAKCRFIVYPEIDLSGIDQKNIKLCARHDMHYYAWLTPSEENAALSHHPVSGGGAWVNAVGKQQIMNWGLTDAVLVLGPLRQYFRQALNLAFDYATQFEGRDLDGQEFVVISESLGSFVVLDAFGNLFMDSAAAQRVGERTADLYFFANQFSLLQLGRIDGLTQERPGGKLGAPIPGGSPVDLLLLWSQSGHPVSPGGKLGVAPRLKQVIAFSDPSDLLTYPVPKLKDNSGNDVALIVNVYDRNEWSFLRLFANPLSAHTGHAGNDGVLKVIFRPQDSP